jgi:hypothetical protein
VVTHAEITRNMSQKSQLLARDRSLAVRPATLCCQQLAGRCAAQTAAGLLKQPQLSMSVLASACCLCALMDRCR